MAFSVDSRLQDDILVLILTGDLIGDTESDAVLRLAEQHIVAGATLCAADLSRVRFLNSSGLTILIGLLTRFRNAGGELILAAPAKELRKLLVITRLEAIFSVTDSVAEATRQLRATVS